MYSKSRDIDLLARALVAAGWTFRRGGKHGRLRSPDGATALTVPCTPSDRRSPANFRCQVRRAMARIHAANVRRGS